MSEPTEPDSSTTTDEHERGLKRLRGHSAAPAIRGGFTMLFLAVIAGLVAGALDEDSATWLTTVLLLAGITSLGYGLTSHAEKVDATLALVHDLHRDRPRD